MEYTVIILRTIFIYFVVYIVLRLMGKREIGKLTIFDLVISIMIAEIAVIVLEDTKRPLSEEILPIAVLMVLQIGIAWLTLKSRKMRLLFDGKPSILIEKGKLNRDEMKKQRYNLDDLLVQLREKKYRSPVRCGVCNFGNKRQAVGHQERTGEAVCKVSNRCSFSP